jgi:hypothetical protein
VTSSTVAFSLALTGANSAHGVAAAVVFRLISGRRDLVLRRLEDGLALLCGSAVGGAADRLHPAAR